MLDPIQQFQDAMQSNSFTPPEIIADGKPHRFDIDKRGNAKGYYQLFTDGVPFGLYGSWAEQEPGGWLEWSAKSENKMTDAERAENQRRWKKAQAERKKTLAEAYRAAAEEALRIWKGSSPASADHAYLKRKKVHPHGIKQDGDDLIIPVRIGGKLASIQRINSDGKKMFLSGGAISGGYHSIGKPDARIFIAEGYATASTIHEATGAAVAVAFNAGNLAKVAKAIRAKLPDINIVIAGDDDQSNVGETKGRAAADAVGGKLVLPQFTENESGTDWNDYAAIHDLDAVRDALQNIPEPVVNAVDAAKAKTPSQASTLINIAQNQKSQDGADLFHDPSGVAYVTVEINGVRKTLPVRGKDYRNLLRRELYQQDGRNASAQAIDDALGTIEGQAMFDGAEHAVNMRCAADEQGAFWLDLGNDAWQSVKITADGWQVVNRPGVKWRRPSTMRPLPLPVKGGSWKSLFKIFPLPKDEQVLVIAWLIMALNPHGPYPPIVLQGEQGSGKSVLSTGLRNLIDPNAVPIRTVPRNEQDLIIAARNGWVIALDNLSGMRPWLSDGLCRIATSGGFAARALYSNEDEHAIEATRPIIVNGIDDMTTRGDLAGRSIILNLEPIARCKRVAESDLWRKYEAARPGIMGSLLDAVSMAIRMLPQTHLNELSRMADFEKFIVAAESALWEKGTFSKVYRSAQDEVVSAGLEGSPVAQAIKSFMASRDSWEGTAAYLLDMLPVDDKNSRLKIWPKTARGLSNVVRRLAPSLRADGLDISFNHSSDRKKRLITIRKDNACISSSASSVASETLQDKGFSTDATDASENLSSARKPLQDKGLDATDATDARKQVESNEPDLGDALPPVKRVRGVL